MANNTYVALDKITVGTATPSITFNSIASTYTDLVIVATGLGSANTGIGMQFNGDTTNNYSATFLEGNGSVSISDRQSNTNTIRVAWNALWDASTAANMIINVQNYSNSTTYKTSISRENNSARYVGITNGLWRSTAPITSITLLTTAAANFAVGSTFSLYGIKAWSNETSTKATGGYVYSDSTYWYHSFPFSSTFTPNQSITADILVVAGGGGGGNGGDRGAGGGGAGGLLAFTSQALTATNYTVTVGSGGAGINAGYTTNGIQGNNSQFGALTAAVGGGGGGCEGGALQAGDSGGSGGGGGASSTSRGLGGSGTSGQGNAGGNGSWNSGVASDSNGGGGGGAGAVGGAASNGYVNGGGGVGSSAYSSWGLATQTGHLVGGTFYYAGGGGGSGGGGNQGLGWSADGGYGGGGRGDSLIGSYAADGRPATGGGGGAQSWNGLSGAGGSGIVIVRYAK